MRGEIRGGGVGCGGYGVEGYVGGTNGTYGARLEVGGETFVAEDVIARGRERTLRRGETDGTVVRRWGRRGHCNGMGRRGSRLGGGGGGGELQGRVG